LRTARLITVNSREDRMAAELMPLPRMAFPSFFFSMMFLPINRMRKTADNSNMDIFSTIENALLINPPVVYRLRGCERLDYGPDGRTHVNKPTNPLIEKNKKKVFPIFPLQVLANRKQIDFQQYEKQ
jgi:hypothetical protein